MNFSHGCHKYQRRDHCSPLTVGLHSGKYTIRHFFCYTITWNVLIKTLGDYNIIRLYNYIGSLLYMRPVVDLSSVRTVQPLHCGVHLYFILYYLLRQGLTWRPGWLQTCNTAKVNLAFCLSLHSVGNMRYTVLHLALNDGVPYLARSRKSLNVYSPFPPSDGVGLELLFYS